jgi:AraC-like DNA-binding protein
LCLGEPPEGVRDEGVEEVPVVRIPRGETVEDRALRYMGMLTSGRIGNRADLARHLGVSRSYITKVMRRLPAVG